MNRKITEQDVEAAFQEGYDDFKAGSNSFENRYNCTSRHRALYDAWLEGWHKARDTR